MRQLVLALLAIVFGTSTAMASEFSTTGRNTGEPATPTSAIDEYTIDDGTQEDALGLTAGGRLIWLNSFTVQAGLETITAVRVAFGLTPAGLPGQVLVWSDPNNDGNPTDVTLADLLTSAPLVTPLSDAPHPKPCDFITYAVPPVSAGVAGDRFFLGVCVDHAPQQFPAGLDMTPPNNGRSWVGGGGNTVNCGNPNGGTIGPLLNIDAIGFPGDWCVRGNATGTTPVMESTWGSIKAHYTQ